MKVVSYIAAVLAFRNIPTTILVVLIYAAAFISVSVMDMLPAVPKNQRGLDLNEAYADLHQIAARPHPFNSHANDIVRTYLVSRLTDIVSSHSHAHLQTDLTSNFTFSAAYPSYGVYFEGSNVLMKIDGTDAQFQEKGGVLFSAHYDSVSTASGATDDGMGVVTLLQMAKFFTQHRPKRTVVFNINNGEEDWLNGAHAFLKHPWSNITDTFINLEGAASGGRPILFRATSSFPVKSFSKRVHHPHGNVLSADAFARGVIRSGTDYSVYITAGMRGLDFAFYKGRSLYHTKYDAIPYTIGRERALWAMMESTRDAGEWLTNADKDEGRNLDEDGGVSVENGETPVYFDLFGVVLFVFPLSVLFVTNIVLLVVGPLILLLFFAIEVIVQHKRRRRLEEDYPQTGAVRHVWGSFKSLGWLKGLWKWSKFWVAFVVTAGLQVPLVIGFIKLNPFIAYSSPWLIMISSFTLAYLSLTLTLALPIPGPLSLPERQKQTALIQTYILTWILLLLATITRLGGLYLVTVWNALVWLGAVIGCIEAMFGARGSEGDVQIDVLDADVAESTGHNPRPETDAGSERLEGDRDEDTYGRPESREADTDDVTENTPLIRRQHEQSLRQVKQLQDDHGEDGGAIGWWIVQLLVVLPIPLVLITHIAVILVGALPQTLADGSSAITVYGSFSLISVLLLLPLAPFAFKMDRAIMYIMLVLFLVSTLSAWLLAFPFDSQSPLKVFFQQNVEVNYPINSTSIDLTPSSNVTIRTHLQGASPFLERLIVPSLPSSHGSAVSCSLLGKLDKKRGLTECVWESGKAWVPVPGGRSDTKHDGWFKARVSNGTRRGEAHVSVSGKNTRNCRIYFEGKGISAWRVKGSDSDEWSTVNDGEGMKEVRLWSREWGKEFVVDIKWVSTDERLTGRVACEWAEYESAEIGVGEARGGKIPAFEEILKFLPQWAVVSKMQDGLVEVSEKFTI